MYVTLGASNVPHLTIDDCLRYHKLNNPKNLTTYEKMSINANFAPYMCATSHTCGSDARTFLGPRIVWRWL